MDETALIDSLENNRIAGAGLDVTACEPIESDNRLLSLSDKVVLTPHNAASTEDALKRMCMHAAKNLDDYLTAKYIERAGVDMILVGDSLGMVQLGYETTYPVTMEDMVSHTATVRRGAPNTFIIGDMPYMSYQTSNEEAVHNAGRLTKEALCDAIKLEGGGEEICKHIKAIASVDILVFGHIGLTPQFAAQMGGYKAQGKSMEAAQKLLDEALRIQEAGACAILVEGVPEIVGKQITEKLSIPVLGIGAGSYTHGQLLIYADMAGYYDNFCPKFVKKYAEIGKELERAFKEYVDDVHAGRFPVDGVHTYKISDEERAKIEALM